jgi:glycosyltransferase involved in cell wall biosynthesis
MPVYNTPPGNLDEAIRSVLHQNHPGWELCICDDCSTFHETAQILDEFRGVDPRVKIANSPSRLDTAKATNLAGEFATGQFIAFLDPQDKLEGSAVDLIIRDIERTPEVDVLYTDEDKIEQDGSSSEPCLKPDWSPELLLSLMYLNHFIVVRKSLFLALGGLRHEFADAREYDFALRATAKARQVLHIPQVLYHWRKIPRSTVAVMGNKPAPLLSARSALTELVQYKAPGAEVAEGLFAGSYRVRWPIDECRPVTLLILTASYHRKIEGRGKILLVENAVDSIIRRSTYRNFQILVLDDGAMPAEVRDRFVTANVIVDTYHFQGAFNYAKKLNHAFNLVESEDLIILNDDIEVIAPDWIEALLAFSQRAEIGAVGAMLLYPNHRIQHAGVVLGVTGPTGHIFVNQPVDQIGYGGFTHVIRNYSAVTAAVLATRMSIIREVGGFDNNLAIDYNDIDFCLRLRARGYRIVYTPYAKLYHFEGSSIARKEPNKADRAYFSKRWRDQIASDPYYNLGLPKDRLDCIVARW